MLGWKTADSIIESQSVIEKEKDSIMKSGLLKESWWWILQQQDRIFLLSIMVVVVGWKTHKESGQSSKKGRRVVVSIKKVKMQYNTLLTFFRAWDSKPWSNINFEKVEWTYLSKWSPICAAILGKMSSKKANSRPKIINQLWFPPWFWCVTFARWFFVMIYRIIWVKRINFPIAGRCHLQTSKFCRNSPKAPAFVNKQIERLFSGESWHFDSIFIERNGIKLIKKWIDYSEKYFLYFVKNSF